jgi:hypothetical protein
MGQIFADTDAWAAASMVAFVMVAGWLAGRWRGRHLRLELQPQGKAAVSKFVDASLAVLWIAARFYVLNGS